MKIKKEAAQLCGWPEAENDEVIARQLLLFLGDTDTTLHRDVAYYYRFVLDVWCPSRRLIWIRYLLTWINSKTWGGRQNCLDLEPSDGVGPTGCGSTRGQPQGRDAMSSVADPLDRLLRPSKPAFVGGDIERMGEKLNATDPTRKSKPKRSEIFYLFNFRLSFRPFRRVATAYLL